MKTNHGLPSARGRRTAAVVGAGLAGAAAAWQLAERGSSARAYERSDVVGGCVRTESAQDGLLAWPVQATPGTRRRAGCIAESPRCQWQALRWCRVNGGVPSSTAPRVPMRIRRVTRGSAVVGQLSPAATRGGDPPRIA